MIVRDKQFDLFTTALFGDTEGKINDKLLRMCSISFGAKHYKLLKAHYGEDHIIVRRLRSTTTKCTSNNDIDKIWEQWSGVSKMASE